MKLIVIAVTALAAFFWHAPAMAQSSLQDRLSSMERRLQYLEKRVAVQDRVIVEKDREISNLKKMDDKWFNKVEITGAVELEAAYNQPFTGDSTTDATVATATVGIAAQVHEWVGAEVSLLFEEDDTTLEVDTASFTIAPPEGPWSFTGGQIYVPFGTFETHLISDPLTLEVGETRETAVQLGVEKDGFSGAVYGFNGTNKEGGDNNITGFGAALGYAVETDNSELAISVGYINNVGDSDNLQTVISDTLGSNNVTDYVGAWTASAKLRYGDVTVLGEFLSAVDEFQAGEVVFRSGGAQPLAWTVEAAYGFELMGRGTTAAVSSQGTDEALALELPETRFLAGLSVAVIDHVGVAVEWAHDWDYDTADGSTGNTADTVTAQVAVEF